MGFVPVQSGAGLDFERYLQFSGLAHQFNDLLAYHIDFGIWDFENQFIMDLHDQFCGLDDRAQRRAGE